MRALFLLLSLVPLVWCLTPHPAVVAARQEEERLPHHLRSPALHNPHLREILPLASLLHKGEILVRHRETDAVPRQEIYNILTHAGLFPRRPGYYRPTIYRQRRPHSHQQPQHHYQHRQNDLTNENYFDLLLNPDLLQHL